MGTIFNIVNALSGLVLDVPLKEGGSHGQARRGA